MIWLGKILRSYFWNLMSQASPVPASIAALSSQSMSTPSKLFSSTNFPSFLAQSIGSMLAVVGN